MAIDAQRGLRADQDSAPSQQLNRRTFLSASASIVAGAMALPLLNACAPAQPPAPIASKPTAGGAPAASSMGSRFPTYIPFNGGPKPDFTLNDPLYSDGFENFPAQTFKANQGA